MRPTGRATILGRPRPDSMAGPLCMRCGVDGHSGATGAFYEVSSSLLWCCSGRRGCRSSGLRRSQRLDGEGMDTGHEVGDGGIDGAVAC